MECGEGVFRVSGEEELHPLYGVFLQVAAVLLDLRRGQRFIDGRAVVLRPLDFFPSF
jgi:hypothetical protein